MRRNKVYLLTLYFLCVLIIIYSKDYEITKTDNKTTIEKAISTKNILNVKEIQLKEVFSSNLTIPQLKESMTSKYKNEIPTQWGEKTTGVKTQINTTDKIIALTFDACGGSTLSNGYDSELIYFLRKENIPATLFINSRWIDANYNTFMALSKIPQFEMENHGYLHKPLSVNGKSAYGITGTQNIGEVVDEIILNERKIEELTGRKPKYFRSGTAYYDEVAVKIVNEIGEDAVNFNVLGDAGATFTKEQVRRACLSAPPGSILIFHMNHPEKETAEGIMAAIPQLKLMGYKFVKLDNKYLSSNFTITKDYFYYSVVTGDNLWKISVKYSIPIQEIIVFNDLSGSMIYPGQMLKIPVIDPSKLIPPTEVIHSVVKGDTLWKLSNYYKASLIDIFDRNILNSNSNLEIGKRIMIPINSR
ncbi:polysaccharide deacetylase family protein [Clostridium sp.]|uniref:polysaccharide deacetylase family protein n=1 Tax=Clostridium sp. TaxID=1506 RepID=UPI002608014F|nr:LysM peptidoglycan-binding domain-containing protein [uncultured Clostridium sp.]